MPEGHTRPQPSGEDAAVPHRMTVESIVYLPAYSGPLERWVIERSSRCILPDTYENAEDAAKACAALNRKHRRTPPGRSADA